MLIHDGIYFLFEKQLNVQSKTLIQSVFIEKRDNNRNCTYNCNKYMVTGAKKQECGLLVPGSFNSWPEWPAEQSLQNLRKRSFFWRNYAPTWTKQLRISDEDHCFCNAALHIWANSGIIRIGVLIRMGALSGIGMVIK